MRISPVADFDVDIDIKRLIKEYTLNIKDLMADAIGNNAVLVQKKFHIIRNDVKSELLNNMPYTMEIAEKVKNKFKYKDMTYRIGMPNTAYNWHYDVGIVCYHIPLISNDGCHFVYENERSYTMPPGKLYFVHNGIPHTFVNAGKEPRLHITFETLNV